MCGIVGIAGTVPIRDRGRLIAGRDAMRHRGPDDAGEWWSGDGSVGLGHRRLAIIDLSPSGHQPMAAVGGDLHIVLNGEIYNFIDLRRELMARGHKFHSESDTEVVLASYREWGTGCLARLNGMFAFGLYDESRARLLLARDRAGEKPLFYTLSPRGLRFASELKALLAVEPDLPRRVDPVSLDCYLSMGFVPGQRCILEGVNKLPPAHALVYDLTSLQSRIWRYWQLPECTAPVDATLERGAALLGELETLFEDSVRRQLVADVPVGILLSGGVDSSLIAAMAARAAPKVKTFTVRFPGYGAYDETTHARLIARHFATDHVELDAGAASVDLLERLAQQFDEPMVDSSMIPTYLLSALVRRHCKVALGGEGGDELFGGYPKYSRLLWLQEKLGRVPRHFRSFVAKGAETLLPVGFKGRNWFQGLGGDLQSGVPQVAGHFDSRTRARLLGGTTRKDESAESIWRQRACFSPDLLQRATRTDFENYLAEDLLVKVDRASMLNSLEVRAPFLDHRLVEFAFGQVPSSLKATATSRKVLLKRFAARVLPREFDRERKQGFSLPLGTWLRSGAWRTAFHDILMGADRPIFDRRTVSKLLAGQEKGRGNSERLFALVLFELWRQEYKVTI